MNTQTNNPTSEEEALIKEEENALDKCAEKLYRLFKYRLFNWLRNNAEKYISIGNTDFGCCDVNYCTEEMLEDFEKYILCENGNED